MPTPPSGQLLGTSDLDLAEGGGLAHSLQPVLTRLDHRGPALRTHSGAGGGQLDPHPSDSDSYSSPAFTAQ